MNILGIIQARTGSTRLPNKVLMKINGKSILEQIIDSLRYSKQISQIIVATTTLTEDDGIADLAKKLGVNCYRGSTNDVLKRYYECAKLYSGDLIVRITADDPIILPELIDDVINICKETKCHYVTNIIHPTYPIGICAEVFTFPILKILHENKKDKSSREHVTQDMVDNPLLYDVKEVFTPENLARPNWRLTVDYIEDLELIRKIFSHMSKKYSLMKYEKLIEFLDNNLDLLKINKKYV